MSYVMGIDVAGQKKGFHLAIANPEEPEIIMVEGGVSLAQTVKLAATYKPQVIAIDSPPKAQIQGPDTRQSEQHLHKLGFRIQWTRRPTDSPQEWMIHGQALWEALQETLPDTPLIETFPTAVARDLHDCPLQFPLQFLQGNPQHRHGYKDLLDASLCAWTAIKFLNGTAHLAGEQDELGPIYY